MASQSASNPEAPLTTQERELIWTLLDKRPQQSELISYDSDEIAEVRRLTESELKLISRQSGTESALNKETKTFLDAASVMRALSRVAEDRFERGSLDAAAKTVINAIRWQRMADGLYLSGGVTLPRINPVRLWYLLAEIYLRMDERDLSLKTMQKAGASMGEFSNPPLADLLTEAASQRASTGDAIDRPEATSRNGSKRFGSLQTRNSLLIIAVLVVGLLIFLAFSAQATTKDMIDSNSVGVDYLNIAFGPTKQVEQDEALILAGQSFAALQARLDSWSWLITLSSILPPVHDQYVAMDRMADLGLNVVLAPSVTNGSGRQTKLGSQESVCESANRVSSFDGNLLDQLEKNRSQMLRSVWTVTQGACGVN